MIGCNPKDLEKNTQFGFVQFHPSYDYTDFVEGLRPIKGTSNGAVGFELKPGIFKKFCEKALKDEKTNNKYVFVIDEINRGEISKIFGELFFSIDPGYRGTDGRVQTQYANMVTEKNEFDKELNNDKFGQFFIPKNVYIIGTMNDIDRSVESMDFAFRRRFAFKEITASESKESILLYSTDIDLKLDDLRKLMNAMENVNDELSSLGLSDSYHIGGAYYQKISKYKSKPKGMWDCLWNYHLKGTLYEYFRGEPDADKKMEALKEAYDNALKDN